MQIYRLFEIVCILLRQKIVTARWPEDDWVYGRILSYGEYIEVLEPEHIREIIKKKASKINKKYL